MITIKQIDKYCGRKSGWHTKRQEDIKFARALVHLLANYNEETHEVLKEFVNRNEFELKILVEDKDILVVHPKETGHFVVMFNTGETNNAIVAYPHRSSDSVDSIAYDLVLNAGYKCLIINGFSIAATDEPSSFQKSRPASNADHAPESSFSDFLDEYINHSQYKECYLCVLHGMTSSKSFSTWNISSTGTRTKKDINGNINFFMCLSWTQSEKFKELTGKTNYDFSEFYTLRKDGTKKFLTGQTNCYFITFRGPTTSVCSHIMNADKISNGQGKDKGRVAHCENAISTLGNRSFAVAEYHKEAHRLMALAKGKDLNKAPRDINKLIKWLSN